MTPSVGLQNLITYSNPTTMWSEENSVVNLEDLMQADSLMDYLDEDKAITFGSHFDQIQDYPGLSEKFGDEINKMFNRVTELKKNLVSIQDSMSPDDTLMSFVEKGIDAYESKEDRVTVAFLMGMYVADCEAKIGPADE